MTHPNSTIMTLSALLTALADDADVCARLETPLQSILNASPENLPATVLTVISEALQDHPGSVFTTSPSVQLDLQDAAYRLQCRIDALSLLFDGLSYASDCPERVQLGIQFLLDDLKAHVQALPKSSISTTR
jgi:uncharacterized protein YegL